MPAQAIAHLLGEFARVTLIFEDESHGVHGAFLAHFLCDQVAIIKSSKMGDKLGFGLEARVFD